MKGYVFYALVLLAATLLSFRSGQHIPGKRQKLPNIVIFLADDLGYYDTEPYGNKIVNTPNLNELAKHSLKFTNAFANTPTCIPSRAAILTGLMPQRNGAHANNVKGYPVSEVRPGVQTLPVYLRRAGYRVALAGKRHIFPLDAFPFEFIPGSEMREPGYEEKAGLFTDLNTAAVEQWLDAQGNGQPFCLVVTDNSPHVIWPEKPQYSADSMDVPPDAADTREYRRMRSRYYTDVEKMDRNVGIVLKSLQKNGFDQNTIFIFTSDQGPQFPFAKWNLYDAGVRVPLMIRWPGKIQHGTTEAMVSHIDLLPTIFSIAGIKENRRLDGKSYYDVLLDPGKKHRKEVFLTHSQDGLMNITPMRGLRTEKYKYILNLSPQYAYHTHIDAARDHDGGASYWISWEEKAKTDESTKALIQRYHFRPGEELYDISTDPFEQNNLAGKPGYENLLKQLRIRLADFRARQNDTITGPVLNIQTTWKSESASKNSAH